MRSSYYEPMFYISSAKMPFTIRIEAALKEPVDGDALSYAVNKAIMRYPYFAIQVVEDSGELVSVPNDRPVVVYNGTEIRPLGGSDVNYHLTAASYYENIINFFTSHVITDGCGFFPYVKTVLYYYLCRHYHTELDPKGIRLVDEPFYDDELCNPYPEEKMEASEPFYEAPKRDFFRLRDGGYVSDSEKTVYRLRIREADAMRFNHDNDGSPCVLVSSLMAKAIWDVHPNEKNDLVCAVSFNLRPGLENVHSYRMLCSSIALRYPEKLRCSEVSKICTCSRGMVSLLSQPENVLSYAQSKRKSLEKLCSIPDIQTKKEIFGQMALKDSTENTFSVSYVGKVGLGSIEPYLDSMYNYTDGSTYQTLFAEISAINGWFDIALIQGFSSDVYYRAFLRQLELNGLDYVKDSTVSLNTPELILP